MKPKSTKAALAVAGAALAATLAPAAAQAQQYGSAYDQRGYYYDPCSRDQTSRTAVGAVLGGLAGMALGNNIGNDRFVDRYGRVHDNDTSATVGAVVGALAGGGVGRNSAACVAQPAPRRQQQRYDSYSYAPSYSATPRRYNDYGYGYYDDQYAYDRYQTVPTYGYQDGYGDTYGAYGRQSCRMVESRVRMPDGRAQTRMVQACPDSQGRYQLVD